MQGHSIKNINSNKSEIVFVAGLGSTGSSALIDLLKEVETYYTLENEFRLFVDPGGLVNLHDALVNNWSIFQSDIAIKNFKKIVKSLSSKWRSPNSHIDHSKYLDKEFINQSNEYIEKLINLHYKGIWYGIDNIWIRQLHKIPFIYKYRLFTKSMYVSNKFSNSEFNKLTDNYVKNMIDYCLDKAQKKHFCFNENLSCMFPEKILNMVSGSKIINIIRDPKDVYADSIRVKWMAIPKDRKKYIDWQIAVYNGWMEVEKSARKWDPYSEKLRVVKFEDLILKYDETINSIFKFLNINKDEHVLKKKFLNPSFSSKNIGQWKQFISKEEEKLFNRKFKEFYKRYGYNVN